MIFPFFVKLFTRTLLPNWRQLFILLKIEKSQGGQMKTIFTFISFFSIALMAAGPRYQYKNVTLKNNDGGTHLCLQLDSVSIVDGNKENSSVTLVAGNRAYSYGKTFSYKACASDDVCPAIDYYGNDEHSSKVTAARSSAASAATGFSELTIDVAQVPRFVSYYCVYSLAN